MCETVLQGNQVETDNIPADDHVWVVFSKPLQHRAQRVALGCDHLYREGRCTHLRGVRN